MSLGMLAVAKQNVDQAEHREPLTNQLRIAAVAALLSLGLVACSGGGADSSSTSTPVATRAQEMRGAISTGYADIVQISLKDAALPADLKPSALSVSSGVADGLGVYDGYIRFVSGSDAGGDSSVVLKVALSDRDVLIPVTIETSRSTAIQSESDHEVGSAPTNLIIAGFGPGNAITGDPISFKSSGAAKLSLRASSLTIDLPDSKKFIDLARLATYDAANNALVLSARAMQTVLLQLPSGAYRFNVGLASGDGSFGESFSFTAIRASASLIGTVVDGDGLPVTTLTGRVVALQGVDNPMRQLVKIDGAGRFSTSGLVEGTYFASLVDLSRPNEWVATFPVFSGSPTVDLKLPVQATAKSTSGQLPHWQGSHQ